MASITEYYRDDFRGDKISRQLTVKDAEDPQGVDFTATVHVDLMANSKYVSFLIPATEYCLDIAYSLLRNVDVALRILRAHLISTGVGDERKVRSDELVFTGRVFIYSETELPEESKRFLTEASDSMGLSLVIRDPSYARLRTETDFANAARNEGTSVATIIPSDSSEPELPKSELRHRSATNPTVLLENQAHEILEELSHLDLRTVTIEDIKTRLEVLLSGYYAWAREFRPGLSVYRARTTRSKPTGVRELTYPPPEAIPTDQRVNRARHGVFYCCLSSEGPLAELHPEPDVTAVLTKWETKTKLFVNSVGFTPENLKRLGSVRKDLGWLPKDRSDYGPTQRLVEEALAREFTRPVSDRDEHEYKFTIAVAEIFLAGEDFDGLMYPSVALYGNDVNLAIAPAYVDEHLVFAHARFVRVGPLIVGRRQVKDLDFAPDLGPDGSLQWIGKPAPWVAEKGREVELLSDGREYKIVDGSGGLVGID